jgi:hypothetical protein
MIHRLIIFFLLISTTTQGQELSWHKCLKGSIDKYPVTMHLHKYGHNYRGFYYYDAYQEPVYFMGDDTTHAGQIKLSVFLPDPMIEEKFEFIIHDSTATGEWHTTGRAKALNFTAKEDKTASFHFVFVEGSVKLRPNLPNSPEASYDAATIWPKTGSPQYVYFKKIVGEAFDYKNLTGEIGKLLSHRQQEFFDGYLEENKNEHDSIFAEFNSSYNLSESSQFLMVYYSPQLLTVVSNVYSYTGGAHGNYGSVYSSYDLGLKKKLKIADVINATGKAQLPKLLEKHFRRIYKVKAADPLTEGGLFENKIEPNDNFYVTSKGIGFCYVPYEIAPYAAGQIHVFIPFSELKNYLQPSIKKIIQ